MSLKYFNTLREIIYSSDSFLSILPYIPYIEHPLHLVFLYKKHSQCNFKTFFTPKKNSKNSILTLNPSALRNFKLNY